MVVYYILKKDHQSGIASKQVQVSTLDKKEQQKQKKSAMGENYNLNYYKFSFLIIPIFFSYTAGCLDLACKTCRVGWYHLEYNGQSCYRKCPQGYYPSGQKCASTPKTNFSFKS